MQLLYIDGQDGRYTIKDLDNLFLTDNFIEVQEKIEGTDVLIIDNICIVSASIFGQVEYECRNLKNSQEYFGRLQVILSGSFMQLPTYQVHATMT